MKPTPLLNPDGQASMATMIMLSHHAFRRDLACFAAALERFEPSRAAVLRDNWRQLDEHLHGHHEKEDTGIFPHTGQTHPELAATLAELSAQHTKIDPLLAKGKVAFAGLPGTRSEAAHVVRDITALLDQHLDLEEATVIPTLRDAREFPAPTTDADADLFAGGFAWALDGIAPDVVERVQQMLPAAVLTRLPAARKAYAAERDRAWGDLARPLASRTSVPA